MLTNIILLTQINTAGFGDYIFIILIILATIAQAVAQQRKKERLKQLEQNEGPDEWQQKPRPNRQREVYNPMDEKHEEPSGTFFDRMEEIFDPIQYSPSEPEPSYYEEELEKEQEKVEEILKKNEATPMPGDVTTQSVYHRKKKTSLKKNIRHDFDARKAVIYSEILKRKY